MHKKWSKKMKKIFVFVLNKYQSVKHVSTCIFQGLFRFVALVTKNPLNYFILKVTKFHGDCVKNESARTKNYRGRQTSPPPACLWLTSKYVVIQNCYVSENGLLIHF